MCCTRTPLQQLHEARQIALDYGCFVVEKKDQKGPLWLLYRKNPDPSKKPIFIGKRANVAALRKFVEDVCIARKSK